MSWVQMEEVTWHFINSHALGSVSTSQEDDQLSTASGKVNFSLLIPYVEGLSVHLFISLTLHLIISLCSETHT